MDQASEDKAISPQLQSVQELYQSLIPGDKEGEISDQRIAMQTYQEHASLEEEPWQQITVMRLADMSASSVKTRAEEDERYRLARPEDAAERRAVRTAQQALKEALVQVTNEVTPSGSRKPREQPTAGAKQCLVRYWGSCSRILG